MIFSITTYFRSSLSELKKVSWPSREKTVRLTFYVILISVAVAASLGLLDYVLFKLLTAVLTKK